MGFFDYIHVETENKELEGIPEMLRERIGTHVVKEPTTIIWVDPYYIDKIGLEGDE